MHLPLTPCCTLTPTIDKSSLPPQVSSSAYLLLLLTQVSGFDSLMLLPSQASSKIFAYSGSISWAYSPYLLSLYIENLLHCVANYELAFVNKALFHGKEYLSLIQYRYPIQLQHPSLYLAPKSFKPRILMKVKICNYW